MNPHESKKLTSVNNHQQSPRVKILIRISQRFGWFYASGPCQHLQIVRSCFSFYRTFILWPPLKVHLDGPPWAPGFIVFSVGRLVLWSHFIVVHCGHQGWVMTIKCQAQHLPVVPTGIPHIYICCIYIYIYLYVSVSYRCQRGRSMLHSYIVRQLSL